MEAGAAARATCASWREIFPYIAPRNGYKASRSRGPGGVLSTVRRSPRSQPNYCRREQTYHRVSGSFSLNYQDAGWTRNVHGADDVLIPPCRLIPPGSPRDYLFISYQINFNVTNVDMSESGGFYDPPQVKLEMEEFKDLSSFLPDLQPSTSSNTIDELNTPIFGDMEVSVTVRSWVCGSPGEIKDKDEFDFSVQAKPSSYSFKHEPDPYGNPFIYNGLTDRSEVLQNESTFSHISNNILQNNETSYVIQPTEINSGSSDSGQSPQYQTTMNDSLQSYVNGSSVICTPEESNSSNTSSNGSPNLYLNTNIINSLSQINSLSTPDVIDTVVEMDGNFNILDFVPSEEITTVNPEDIFSTYSLPEKHQVQAQPEKPSRRKRKISDSDEEYVPPVKSRKSYAGLHSSESDSDYEEPKPKKRGKGRKASSTSNDSREENVSRYRDLRDKNNEASRRSRLKRKQKELEIEKECDELTEKNIKLKAQVEELEKTVSSYRDNLFKIMLKK